MVSVLLITIFVLGYLAIALEHNLKVNKAAPALITGVLCWAVYVMQGQNPEEASEQLLHHLGEISSILFFLMGAMTIVELIDQHDGFDIITEKIRTRSMQKLLIIVSILTFFLSALLDNLTSSIVMVSLCGKILKERENRLWFAAMIIIAANAGGAWSPLGDVTTTMLWIGGQISAFNIIKTLIVPSLVGCVVPMLIIVRKLKNKTVPEIPPFVSTPKEKRDGKIVLVCGILGLIFVPVFKTVTHLPPFMGMMLSLGFMWIVTTLIHKKHESNPDHYLTEALSGIDTPSILFFLGILLAVSALQSYGLLADAADFLDGTLKNFYAIGVSLGLLSAILDNVPLVAAVQGMYSLAEFPKDHDFWEFIALTTGTGGSAIIIGSAAGVAVMGIESIRFGWYIKNVTWIVLIGFFASVATFILMRAV